MHGETIKKKKLGNFNFYLAMNHTDFPSMDRTVVRYSP